MKTVKIKGKDYVEVSERLKEFRSNEKYKGYSLTTEIVSLEKGTCVMRAIITSEKGVLVATGTAYEKEDSTFINKTSYIENCETSAWGRALGNLGIGIDIGIASADEINKSETKILPEIQEHDFQNVVKYLKDGKTIDDLKKIRLVTKEMEERLTKAIENA